MEPGPQRAGAARRQEPGAGPRDGTAPRTCAAEDPAQGPAAGAALEALHARVAMSERMAAIGAVAAGAAHDLFAPVGAALAALDEAARLARAHAGAPGEGGAPLLRALEDARAACEQIRCVARDLRTFARAGDGPAEETAVDVVAVLDSAARMAAHELSGRARLVRAYAPVPPARASASRLGQVFLNLIVNAAQAIAPGAPDRNEVRLRAAPAPGGRIALEIEDTGVGMTPEVRARLFTPFFTTKPDGTGLGLGICRRIVRELGGELEVASEPGRGTRMRVLLPGAPREGGAADAPAAPAPPAGGAPPSGPPAPGAGTALPPGPAAPAVARPRVLVVDDQDSIHRAMGRMLGKTCEVACADAAGALALLERGERFDLVLCDLVMPGLSGAELRRRIVALDPGQGERFAFLTGGTFADRADPALGGAPVLDKAASPADLRAAVDARLRETRRAPRPA